LNKLISIISFSLLIVLNLEVSWAANDANTKYLMFQMFVSIPSNSKYMSDSFPPNRDVALTRQDLISTIGQTGNKKYKLGFTTGPLSFNHSDEDIKRIIHESFQIAKQRDLAVAFHIDDQMFWENHKELIKYPNNIEWINWEKTPNTGRKLEWSLTPTSIAPQLCLNSVEVRNEASKRGSLIAQTIKGEISKLVKQGREHLFAGVIIGWESMIGRDFKTGKYLGYCALSNLGFSSKKLPKDFDATLSRVLKDYNELWAKEMAKHGVDKNKIFSHFAFAPEGQMERS